MKRGKCILGLVAVGLVAASLTGCLQLQPNQPQALFTVSLAEQVVPFTASFDATLSYAPDSQIVSYLWSFGDGGAEEGPVAVISNQFAHILAGCAEASLGDLLIDELRANYSIAIVTHSMQQAARVSQRTAYFHLGDLVEVGETTQIFTNPRHKLTEDYITGRFG